MFMCYKVCSMFLLLWPIGVVHSGERGDREISRNITTIRHFIDSATQFVSKPFPVSGEADGRLLTAPHQSFATVIGCAAEHPMSGTVEDQPTSPASAAYMHRMYVRRTDVWPYSSQGHLKLFFGEEACDGSGVLIGPHHVLTCAHNVYDPKSKKWVDKMIFCPGLVGMSAPFGSAEVTRIYIDKAWTMDDDTADMALLTLSVPLGQKAGYFGLASLSDDELGSELVEVTGYPADKGAVYMWTMLHELKKNLTRDTLDYEIDTYQGQSGGAVWVQHGDAAPYVIGVHTRDKTASNRGVRISALKFTWLIQLLSETAELETGGAAASAIVAQSAAAEGSRSEDPAAALLAKQQNEAQKLRMFEGAAEKGDKRAQRYLANLYRTGQGVERSLRRSIYWYQKAAAQADSVAQKMLGDFHRMGKGVDLSFEKAVAYYQQSADLDNEYAMKALGDCYKTGGPGFPPSDEKAFLWYQRASDKYLASAQEQLAFCYYGGKGVAQNYELAAQWYKKAADQDHPVAKKMLGDLYRDGRGVPQNYEIAAELYLESATRGNAYAQKALGDLYKTGRGVLQNIETAGQWYARAADKLESAKEALAALKRPVRSSDRLGHDAA